LHASGWSRVSKKIKLPVLKLLKLMFISEQDILSTEPNALFHPSVEVIEDGAFLTAHPYDLIRSGKVHDVPWLSGYNADEGLLFIARKLHQTF